MTPMMMTTRKMTVIIMVVVMMTMLMIVMKITERVMRMRMHDDNNRMHYRTKALETAYDVCPI